MTPDPHRTPLVALSPAWRYSLKQILFGTALVAVGCVALRNASSAWVAIMFGVTLVALGGVSLCAVFRAGHRRAFWIGFAAAGWLYLLVLMYGWSLDPNSVQRTANPLSSHRLATTKVTNWAHNKLFPETIQRVAAGDLYIAGGGFNFRPPAGASFEGFSAAGVGPSRPTTVFLRYGPDLSEFANVAHALWTLLFAFCGGWFARWAYASGLERGAQDSANAADDADKRG